MLRRRGLVQAAALVPALMLLPACAGIGGRPAPRVDLAGIDSLPGEGFELRFMLKLRVQNPGDADLRYDGIWVELELRGQRLASGGAPVAGVVPRFGEALVLLPGTASGLSLARQLLSLLRGARDGSASGPVAYALRGRLGGAGWGGGDFESRGEIDLGG
ncbi:MAG: LEA type 2 family protein [Rubrivivax sp.]|nr:LEA type 2 family protein [Rubrivivax sp.]